MQIDSRSKDRLVRIRERVLDLTYTLAVRVRGIARHIVRPTEVGVRVLVVQDDRVLLVRHRTGPDPWSLPGGGVKMRESLEAASYREVLEEAGCPVRVERLHGVYHYFGQGSNNYIVVFVCTPLAALRPPVGDLEIADARFFPLHAPINGTDLGSRRRIAEYLRGEAGIAREW